MHCWLGHLTHKIVPELTYNVWNGILNPSEIVAHLCLRSADTTTLQVPSTRRATLGGRAFLVAAVRAWNSLPPETQACSSLLTFLTETKSHLFVSHMVDLALFIQTVSTRLR